MSDNAYAWVTQSVPTITRRDLYAGLAMQGLISCPDTTDMSIEDCVSYAVDYADAMIAELEEKR
jgi:hypothetical protein